MVANLQITAMKIISGSVSSLHSKDTAEKSLVATNRLDCVSILCELSDVQRPRTNWFVLVFFKLPQGKKSSLVKLFWSGSL